MGPIGRRRDREGSVQVEEQAVGGNGLKWRPVVRQGCKGEMEMCQSKEEEEPWDSSDVCIWFQELVSFLGACAEGLSKMCLRSIHEMFIPWGTVRQANSDPSELT